MYSLNDIMIVAAFSSALTEMQDALPPEIQEKINAPNSIENLDTIAEDYPPLDLIYKNKLSSLRQYMSEKERLPTPDPLMDERTAEFTNIMRTTKEIEDDVCKPPNSVDAAKKNRKLIQYLLDSLRGKKC